MVEHSFTIELPGEWERPQAYYFSAGSPGILTAEVSLLHGDPEELKGNGFDVYVRLIS